MKLPRSRFLSVSLALTMAPLMGAAVSTPLHAADIIAQTSSSTDAVYGLASRLPKDTEAFGSLYRLRGMLDALLESNLAKKVMANETLMQKLELDDIKNALENDPQVKEHAILAADLLGSELTIALPAGFSKQFTAMFKAMPALQASFLMARAGSPGGSSDIPKELVPVILGLSDLEMPPVILSLKAGKHKETVKAILGQVLNQIPGDVMAKLDEGKFEADGASFESLTVRVGKVLDEDAKDEMARELGKALGDEEKGAALAKKLQAKTAEVAWGWLDDYLIISLGQNHSHVKFVSAADSVLTRPEVATRAAQLAPKKPFAFSYTSQETLRSFGELGGFFEMLAGYAELGKKAGAPVKLDGLIAELKALDTKADALWPNDADAAVAALWWDGGLQGESWGGAKLRGLDCTKPLSLPSLSSDKTFLMCAGRSNAEYSNKVWSFIEDTGASLLSVYQKDVKEALPDDARQGAVIAETVGIPMVKEIWKSLQAFRAAMGPESALLVNLDGTVPNIPGVDLPPDVKTKGRIPRIAWVSELKDRAKLTESWAAAKGVISSIAGFAAMAGQNIKTDVVEKKDGTVEMYGFALPMDLGDVWPHAGITPTQYYLSSSLSFTKELAAKPTTSSGPALGGKANVNFPALWNFAAEWVKIIPVGQEESELVEFGLSAARCLGALELEAGEEAGQAHGTIHWKITDAK